MNTGRLLKTFFVILLLVTLGEIAYYLYYQSNKETNMQPSIPQASVNIPTTVQPSQPPETDAAKKDNEVAKLLLQNLKKSLDQYQNKILVKSQKTDVYESVIKTIEFTGGSKNTIKYDALIALEYKPDENFTIYLNKNDLNKTKVFMVENDKQLQYSFSSLKSGDRVKIELVTNVLEYFDKNTEQITITKVK